MGTKISDTHIGELPAGSVDRRWEPEIGIRKHNERIHRESKFADNNKKLPFTFSKPKKYKKSQLLVCNNCGHVFGGNINTVGVICSNCKTFATTTPYVGE